MAKKLKFLCMIDPHERENPPKNRIDDWQATLDAKASEILAIAKKHNVAAILHAGDFLDSPKVSDNYLSKIIERWGTVNVYDLVKKMSTGEITLKEASTIMKNNIPIVGIAGNHDEFGGGLGNFHKTSLHFLEKIGFLTLIEDGKHLTFKADDFDVAISGSWHKQGMDDDPDRKSYVVDRKEAEFHIHLVHGMLLEKSAGNLYKHTCVNDISHTAAHLTISGLDHMGFGPLEINNKIFVNPGSITRLKRGTQKELSRQIQVMLIEISKKDGIKLTMIPLKSALPSDLVISKAYAPAASSNKQIVEIEETINKASTKKQENILDIIEREPETVDFTKDDKEDITNRIIEKMGKDPMTPLSDKTPYYIEKLIIDNFQCHKHTEIEFCNGLNVFTGESDSGKSSIMRAFSFVYGELSGGAKDYIKHGEKEARVSLFLSNGNIVTRVVEAKQNGFNGYVVFDASQNVEFKVNTKSTPQIQQLLGYCPLSVDEKTHFSLNFLNQDDAHFFIGKNVTPALRAKIIGTIYKTHFADFLLREYETSLKKDNILLRNKIEEVQTKQQDVDRMSHVVQMEKDLADAEKLYTEIEALNLELNKLKWFKTKMTEVSEKGKRLKNMISELDGICSARDLVNESRNLSLAKTTGEKLAYLNKNISELDKRVEVMDMVISKRKNLEEAKKTYAEKENVSNISKKLKKLTGDIRMYQDIIENANILTSRQETVDVVKSLIKCTEIAKRARVVLENGKILNRNVKFLNKKCQELKATHNDIIVMNSEMIELVKIKSSLANILENGQRAKANIENFAAEERKCREEYEKLLMELGECPTCHQKFDINIINEMQEKIKIQG